MTTAAARSVALLLLAASAMAISSARAEAATRSRIFVVAVTMCASRDRSLPVLKLWHGGDAKPAVVEPLKRSSSGGGFTAALNVRPGFYQLGIGMLSGCMTPRSIPVAVLPGSYRHVTAVLTAEGSLSSGDVDWIAARSPESGIWVAADPESGRGYASLQPVVDGAAAPFQGLPDGRYAIHIVIGTVEFCRGVMLGPNARSAILDVFPLQPHWRELTNAGSCLSRS